MHGDTEGTVLDKRGAASTDDHGVAIVETRGCDQGGVLVCTFQRKVQVPKQNYLQACGGRPRGSPRRRVGQLACLDALLAPHGHRRMAGRQQARP